MSDLRFSNTLNWSTLPLPTISEELRANRRRGGRGLDARMTHPERPLAEHYGPLTMGPTLVSSQGKLDAVVDRAFGALRTCRSELGRQQVLFARYTEMTGWGHATLATAGIAEGHGYGHANGNG